MTQQEHTFKIVPATVDDAPFIAQLVAMAESAGLQQPSYANIFSISADATIHMLKEIAAEDIEGLELCYPNFLLIKTEDGQPVGGCAAWVESDGITSSNFLKAQLLAYALGKEKWEAAAENLKLLSIIDIPRMVGNVQLEAFGLLPDYRGKGLIQALISAQIQRFAKDSPKSAEIHCMAHNTQAMKAYTKCGFVKRMNSGIDIPILKTLVGGTTKVLLEKKLTSDS